MSTNPASPPSVHVVAAVIERDNKILIGQRKPRGRHGLKWEFPGGKVETGETLEAALARELQEELAIVARIGEQLDHYEYRYDGSPITALWFYRVTEFEGDPQNLDFNQIAWVDPARMPEFDFLEGDLDFIARYLAKA